MAPTLFARDTVVTGYDLYTIQLSGTAISSSPQLNMSVSKVDNVTVQSRALEMGIEALTSGVASLAANSSERFATTVVEMDTDGRHYTAYGLDFSSHFGSTFRWLVCFPLVQLHHSPVQFFCKQADVAISYCRVQHTE
jgi:hypothetical protein